MGHIYPIMVLKTNYTHNGRTTVTNKELEATLDNCFLLIKSSSLDIYVGTKNLNLKFGSIVIDLLSL